MLAAELLMGVSILLMALIAGFLVLVNRSVQRQQRERQGDLRHVKIPHDARGAQSRRNRPKPPYRPL